VTVPTTSYPNPIPGLAESWRTLDEKTWQFKLRPGVVFHNGEPVNATAVKETIDRVRDAKTQSQWAGRFTLVERVDAVDDATANIVTKEPWATLVKVLYLAPIVPPKYLAEKGAAGFAQVPVGTGPFKFKEWKQDSLVTLEANTGYWDGSPKVQTITVRAYPEDSTLVAAAGCGAADGGVHLGCAAQHPLQRPVRSDVQEGADDPRSEGARAGTLGDERLVPRGSPDDLCAATSEHQLSE
jgi:ABC-type transport system substrate-binding protein